jgi:hypothetical protein
MPPGGVGEAVETVASDVAPVAVQVVEAVVLLVEDTCL